MESRSTNAGHELIVVPTAHSQASGGGIGGIGTSGGSSGGIGGGGRGRELDVHLGLTTCYDMRFPEM
jgi:hypothetical protein